MDIHTGLALERVEHAPETLRAHLVWGSVNRWSDEHVGALAQSIAAKSITVGPRYRTVEYRSRAVLRRDSKLPRSLLRLAIRFVNDNLDAKLRWEEIAAAVGLDPTTFGATFRLATGMTPRRYVIRCRIRKAMRLLTIETMTLADIALEVGCSCQSHLTTMFRTHLGTTPGALRRAARKAGPRSAYGSPRWQSGVGGSSVGARALPLAPARAQ
jgi:transcriptional regulator GlxA family with amidase domain